MEAADALNSVTNFLGKEGILRATLKHDKTCNEHIFKEKPYPNASDYPPEEIEHYLKQVEDAYLSRLSEAIRQWFLYWKRTDRKEDAYNIIMELDRKGMEIGCYDVLFDYSLEYHGKEAAYLWIVKDMQDKSGWFYILLRESRSDTRHRWENVKKYYPERWFNFIIDTLKLPGASPWRGMAGATIFAQIVNYCIFMDQLSFAEKITDRMVQSALELVSPLNLPTPDWVKRA